MKRVLVPVAGGFEDIETAAIVDVLRRAGIEVVLAGTAPGALRGSRGVTILPDASLEDAAEGEFDAVILPGGQPGVDNLRGDTRVLELLRRSRDRGILIGAICAAPLVLRDAGLLDGARITSHPSIESGLEGVSLTQARVERDGRLITSRGPGTAIEFALVVAAELAGRDKAKEIAEAMLAPVPEPLS